MVSELFLFQAGYIWQFVQRHFIASNRNAVDILIIYTFFGGRVITQLKSLLVLRANSSIPGVFSGLRKQKKPETRFCRRKTAEHNNAKINIFPIIPSTSLLFKARAFLQIFSPRNFLFQQVLRASVFLNSKCLTFLYLLPIYFFNITHIPLFINLFVSLIDLRM